MMLNSRSQSLLPSASKVQAYQNILLMRESSAVFMRLRFKPHVLHCSINDTTVPFVTAAIVSEDRFTEADKNSHQMSGLSMSPSCIILHRF
jgi:hypothetical protein